MLKWSIWPRYLQEVLNQATKSEPQERETDTPAFPDESFLLGHSTNWSHKNCFWHWLFWTVWMWLVASVGLVGRDVFSFPKWVRICLEPSNAALQKWQGAAGHTNVVLEAAVPRSWLPLNPAPGGSQELSFPHACRVKSGAEDLTEPDALCFMFCAYVLNYTLTIKYIGCILLLTYTCHSH